MTPRPGAWTWLGILLALLGPLFVAGPLAFLAGDPTSPAGIFAFLCGMWLLVIATAAIVVGAERRSLMSIGLGRIRLRAVGLGLATAAAILLSMQLALAPLDSDAMTGMARDKETFTVLPTWLKLFTALTAGIAEEWLYRGYAITRLSWVTGNRTAAAAISLAIFTVGHVPFWRMEAAIAILIAALALTLVYLWTRDLVPVVVAHVAVDAISLFAPALLDHV